MRCTSLRSVVAHDSPMSGEIPCACLSGRYQKGLATSHTSHHDVVDKRSRKLDRGKLAQPSTGAPKARAVIGNKLNTGQALCQAVSGFGKWYIPERG